MRYAALVLRLFWLAPLGCAGCSKLPPQSPEQALYVDLRKIVEVGEDDGWTVDHTRLEQNQEVALRSVCQVDPRVRAALAAWLSQRIAETGGPAQQRYLHNGGDLAAISETLSLERTLALLQRATSRTDVDCPFWLPQRQDFRGEQSDAGRFVVLGETQAFGTIEVPGPIPALGGGGRILLGRGLSQTLSVALGADAAASGTFIPSKSSQGIDAYMTLAAPVLLRFSRFSRIYDVELAPVMRFAHGQDPWPPGARIELGFGYSAVRRSPWMSYFMFYGGYEVHDLQRWPQIDHTFQLGTKLSVDWLP